MDHAPNHKSQCRDDVVPALESQSKGSYNQGKGIVGRESRRRARGRQARVAGLALLARPLVVSVVGAPPVYARLLDAAEDLALFFAHVRGLVPVLRREVMSSKRSYPRSPTWETNRPRNKSDECIWSDPALKSDVVDHLRDTYDYYGFCDACLNQHANGTLSLLEPTMRARQRAKNRTV